MFYNYNQRLMNRHHASTSGFTLIELLVVITIIVVLIALLMPVMAGARKVAQAAQCSANEHQISIAMLAYSNTFKGIFPNYRFNTNNLYWYQIVAASMDMAGKFGSINANIYVSQSQWICPTNPGRVFWWNDSNYAYNYWISWKSTDPLLPRSYWDGVDDFPNPSMSVLITEGLWVLPAYASGYPERVYELTESPTIYTGFPHNTLDPLNVNHQFQGNETGNFIFIDGHVGNLSYESAGQLFNQKRLQWSRDNIFTANGPYWSRTPVY